MVGGIDDDIEEVEQAVFEGGTESTERIYFLKREVIEFHRAVAPLIPPLEAIERGGLPADARGASPLLPRGPRPNAGESTSRSTPSASS